MVAKPNFCLIFSNTIRRQPLLGWWYCGQPDITQTLVCWHIPRSDIAPAVWAGATLDCTKVTYLSGNYDKFPQPFLHQQITAIYLGDEVVHTTVNHRQFLILHGDQFDGVMQFAPWLTHWDDWVYERLLVTNTFYNRWRHWLGYLYWSISTFLKQKTKTTVTSRLREIRGIDCIFILQWQRLGGKLHCLCRRIRTVVAHRIMGAPYGKGNQSRADHPTISTNHSITTINLRAKLRAIHAPFFIR